jgi:RNA polymerase sigma-70 factor (ECF subfamily)
MAIAPEPLPDRHLLANGRISALDARRAETFRSKGLCLGELSVARISTGFPARASGDLPLGAIVHCQAIAAVRMDRVSDSELLERARQGHADAFSTLVRRHDRYLYRMARSILRDEQEAEDVVQETYLKALPKIVDFRGEASLRTWLTRIALNEALQRKRRQRLHVDLGEVDMARERVRSQIQLSPLTQATPESEAARNQIRHVLEGAIDDLPPAFRTVLVLRDVEDASVEETAKVLGIKAETVRTRLHRARNMLRERLGEQFAAVLKDVFPFERPRCDALVGRLLGEVGFLRQSSDEAKS